MSGMIAGTHTHTRIGCHPTLWPCPAFPPCRARRPHSAQPSGPPPERGAQTRASPGRLQHTTPRGGGGGGWLLALRPSSPTAHACPARHNRTTPNSARRTPPTCVSRPWCGGRRQWAQRGGRVRHRPHGWRRHTPSASPRLAARNTSVRASGPSGPRVANVGWRAGWCDVAQRPGPISEVPPRPQAVPRGPGCQRRVWRAAAKPHARATHLGKPVGTPAPPLAV